MAKRLIIEKGFSIFRKHQAITGMRSLYTCSTAMQVFSCYTRISHTPLCLTSSAYQRVNIIQPVWLGSGSLVRKNSNFTRSPLYLHSQTSYDTWKYKRHTRVWPFYLSPGRSYRPSVTYLYLLMIAGAWPIELCTPCSHVFKWGDIQCKHSIIPPVNLFQVLVHGTRDKHCSREK